MQLQATSIIGASRGNTAGAQRFQAVNPATGAALEPVYVGASGDEIETAARMAAAAFERYGQSSGAERAAFLRTIAANLEGRAAALVERASAETGLPAGRIQSEIGRACNQLRMFAGLAAEGSWVDARIDRADPQRTPAPKPDVRSMLRPIGPVAVFCASNFPLAFSVAGGDTASALAAGNPVIVNAHHAHPGTAEIAGLAIRDAVAACNLPEGVFSLIYGAGTANGQALVRHPAIKAIGFTGSRAGGLALVRLAQARPEPIPVYAEMSSVNPTVILPGALRERGEAIAGGLHASATLGAGQFCTNPGLVFLPAGAAGFRTRLAGLVAATPPAAMLTAGICAAYGAGVAALARHPAVETLAQAAAAENDGSFGGPLAGSAALFATDAASFMADKALAEEVFGPATLLVGYDGPEQLRELAAGLEGQLTATIHANAADLAEHAWLVPLLAGKAGRLIVNGFPTGVEVGPAMVHGGPFPATSDGRSTSVGTRAILRFARPVCYQDMPEIALPDALKDSNPLNILRLVDGAQGREALA